MARDSTRPERFEGHEYPQVIPEPDEIRAGSPAPWANLGAGERQGFTIDLVRQRLFDTGRTFDVAAWPVQFAEMTSVADDAERRVEHRSAVLVALFEQDGEVQVILTRRARNLSSHRGEIALPGGRSDHEETPVATALREAREEVGLDPSLVTPLGWLSPIVTFASSSAIWPVVGTLEHRPELTIDPGEVERVFTIALRDLVADGVFLEERWRRGGTRPGADRDGFFPIYFYRVPYDVIWGATARVLTELLCVVTGVKWPDAERVSGEGRPVD
ncbi:MAG: CoA pyrophosphatase [Acidimicrobiales bacterium]